MSWLSTGLGALSQLTEKAQKAAESVKEAIHIDKDLLAKLTLNTDEMKAQRQMFGEEATRKAQVKDMLSGMLPWETKDAERDILVEECKEAILKLSAQEETFYGPYEMPGLAVKLEAKKKEDAEDVQDGEDNDENEEDETEAEVARNERKPSNESLAKLAKLEPLPPLLRDFDLDSHVGLIKRLLQEDPTLSKMQSSLSGWS
jgi:hypothetical protein